MKRIIAVLLVLITVFSCSISLAGCGATTADAALTMGQWLSLIADSFGMTQYTERTPYFANVNSENAYFGVFQTAAEWDVIEPNEKVDAETPVKWKDVLISLVNAGEFMPQSTSDNDKIDYAIEHFDPSIRAYWGNRYIKMKEAIPLLDKAQLLWVNKKFTTNVEEASFSEDVKNYVENKELVYTSQDDKVSSTAPELMELQVGDVYTLPSGGNTAASINRVAAVEYVDGQVIITNDTTFSEEDAAQYIEEIKVQDTSAVDFSRIEGIYDEAGNPIPILTGAEADSLFSSGEDDLQVLPLGKLGQRNNAQSQQMGVFAKASIKMKVEDYDIAVTFSTDDVSIKISKKDEVKNRYKSLERETYAQVTFDNVELTKEVDYSWGKLHSATLKMDYKTTIEGGITTEKGTDIGSPVPDNGEAAATDKDKGVKTSLSSVVNQYKTALSDINGNVKNSKVKDDIYICRVKLPGTAFLNVNFIIKGAVTAEGNVKITFELEGAQGIQYKKGNIRQIKSKSTDIDFAAEAKVEVTAFMGLEATILNKINIVSIGFTGGIGGTVSMKCHLFDEEMHLISTEKRMIPASEADALMQQEDTVSAEDILELAHSQGMDWAAFEAGSSMRILRGICIEWKAYPILRFGVEKVGLIGKTLNLGFSVEILGSKNTMLKGHIDFPNNLGQMLSSNSVGSGLAALLGINAQCTYDFKPWDAMEEELENIEDTVEELLGDQDQDGESDELDVTDRIMLTDMRIVVHEKGTAKIGLTGLPKGYEPKDLIASMDDQEYADFNIKTGVITGKKLGITQVKVETSDHKYKAYFVIIVTRENDVQFEGLPDIVYA